MTLLERTRNPRSVATVLGAVTAAATVGSISVAYYIVDKLTKPQPIDPTADYGFTPWELKLPFEDVSFPARNGSHMVRGWWLPQENNTNKVVIACSGYRGRRSDLLGIGRQLWEAGNTVLLIDFYGHGSNRGTPLTLGFHELSDFLGAVDYAVQRLPDAAIGALGYSMGGAVVIMAAARDQRIRAVLADSPFVTHRDIIAASLHRFVPSRLYVPDEPFLALADRLLQWRAGYRFDAVSPLREVALISPRPLFLIHGTGDIITPFAHSEKLFAAAQHPKELWLIDGAAHCCGYFVERDMYCQRVREFFQKSLDETTDQFEGDLINYHAVDGDQYQRTS